eukprot:g5579.t1
MERKKLWLANVLAYVVNAVFVAASNFGGFGSTNAEVSDDNPTFITPASWAFTIWGVIFLFELIFVVWGAFEANRNSRIVQEGVNWWFAVACVVQAAWSVVFAQELLVVSAILLCVIAFTLFMAVVSLSKVMEEGITMRTLPFWGVYFPIGLHGGWTLAAALVNINLALELADVGGELSALILSVVLASVFAVFGSLVFHNHDYRRERLGKDIADGVNGALQTLRIALLVVGFAGIIYRRRKRTRSSSALVENSHGFGVQDQRVSAITSA